MVEFCWGWLWFNFRDVKVVKVFIFFLLVVSCFVVSLKWNMFVCNCLSWNWCWVVSCCVVVNDFFNFCVFVFMVVMVILVFIILFCKFIIFFFSFCWFFCVFFSLFCRCCIILFLLGGVFCCCCCCEFILELFLCMEFFFWGFFVEFCGEMELCVFWECFLGFGDWYWVWGLFFCLFVGVIFLLMGL